MKAAFSGSVRALPLFQRAVAIDPDFALAHAHIGFRYSGMGESALARQSLLKAYQLRNRASDVERFYIETLYDRDFTGNLERERRTLETWAESYPRDASPHTLIAGLALSSTGQYELAIAETEKAIALNPDHDPGVCQQGTQSAPPESPRRCVADRASGGRAEAGIRSVALDPVFRRLPEG